MAQPSSTSLAYVDCFSFFSDGLSEACAFRSIFLHDSFLESELTLNSAGSETCLMSCCMSFLPQFIIIKSPWLFWSGFLFWKSWRQFPSNLLGSWLCPPRWRCDSSWQTRKFHTGQLLCLWWCKGSKSLYLSLWIRLSKVPHCWRSSIPYNVLFWLISSCLASHSQEVLEH